MSDQQALRDQFTRALDELILVMVSGGKATDADIQAIRHILMRMMR